MVDETETLGGALEDVRAYCAVVELGTISAAARQLGETKGGISRRISRLERRLDTALLARTPRAVSATEEGLAFYAKARDALTLLADAVEGARQARSVPRGHLRVTAPHDLGLEVLPELVVAFRAVHPQITVELVLSDALLDLAAHRIDLALRATTDPLPDMGYRASTLIDFHLRLYAAPAVFAAHGMPRTPADLAAYDLVVARGLTGAGARLRLGGARGQQTEVLVRPAVQASDFAGVHRLLVAGGGVGILPDVVAAGSVAAGQLVPVLSGWTFARGRLHAISVGGAEAPARVRVFRDFLRTALSGRAGVVPGVQR
ncbi:LysR family transcriptional regulator [Ectothiorhodospiraceae bacterium 2226]|nr:LysR family transcriptional regulator [Ectothiorhodospiraceae bacterium 2226]